MYHIVPKKLLKLSQVAEFKSIAKNRPSQKMGQKTSQKMGRGIFRNCLTLLTLISPFFEKWDDVAQCYEGQLFYFQSINL